MNIPDATGPRPVEQDTRGILDPYLLRQRVQLSRYPPGEALAGIVDRFWAVRWDLPAGAEHRQQVLTHPGANVAIGPADGQGADGRAEAQLYGVSRRVSTRRLRGAGATVAAMTTVGGLGALIDGPASRHTGRVVPLGPALGMDAQALLAELDRQPDEPARVGVLAAALERACRPAQLAPAREVSAVARVMEDDRSVRRMAQLARHAGVSERTLQRMFLRYAGVSPGWVLRRYRLLDAAEAVRDGAPVNWAELAAELGYADQAHLIREFRAAVGRTPAAYTRAQRQS